MNERKCDCKIVAFVVKEASRRRIEISCDYKDCLSLRIWGNDNHVGSGINRVAKSELDRLKIEGTFDGVYIEGNCSERHT